mgnify:CR=1 FL=1
MINFRIVCVLLLSAVLFQNCKKEDPDPLITSITPSQLTLNGNAGEVINFYFTASSKEGLNRLIVSQQEVGSTSTVILDSLLHGIKNASYKLEYIVPEKQKDYTLLLTFRVIDNDGRDKSEARKILVKGKEILLTEFSGATIYSKASGNADAYDLQSMTAKFSGLSPDSLRDVQLFSENDTSSVLSKAIISPAGGQFVLFNGFDYVNATALSLQEAYNSGQKVDKISNLEQGQIILTRLGRNTGSSYAVIKITDVIDLPGSKDDRILFNVKK